MKSKGFRESNFEYVNEEGIVYLDSFLDYLKDHGIDVEQIEIIDEEVQE